MVKLTKKDKIELLTAQTVGIKFHGNITCEIIGISEAVFEDGTKPKLELIVENKDRYDFPLNKTNQTFLADKLEEIGKEPDTDNIPSYTMIEIESYDTGGKGVYQWGLRIVKVIFPDKL